MSCHDASALLALLGLAAELGAVLSILWSVGLGDWVGKQARNARAALRRARSYVRRQARRLWPWSKPTEPQQANLSLASEASVSGSLELSVQRATDQSPPQSFEEVGERLHLIAEDLNRHEREISERAQQVEGALREEIAQARAELARRDDEIDDRVEEEIRTRLAERKLEGIIFAVRVGLQGAGAVVLLFFC